MRSMLAPFEKNASPQPLSVKSARLGTARSLGRGYRGEPASEPGCPLRALRSSPDDACTRMEEVISFSTTSSQVERGPFYVAFDLRMCAFCGISSFKLGTGAHGRGNWDSQRPHRCGRGGRHDHFDTPGHEYPARGQDQYIRRL